MTEPPDERSTPGRAAEADDPVWLAARLAEAQDQLGATRRDPVGPRHGRRRRRTTSSRRSSRTPAGSAVPRPPRSTSPTATPTGSCGRQGPQPGVRRVRGRTTRSPAAGGRSRAAWRSTAGPSRSTTCWPTPTTTCPSSSGWAGYRSIIGAPMIVDDEVVGVLIRLAHHGGAVRRAHPHPADDVRGAGGAGPAQRRALRGPPGAFGRAGPQGRRDGGAGRGRARRSARRSTRTRCSRPSSSTPSSCPAPTAGPSWSTTRRAGCSACARPTARATTSVSS